jgi:predicted short-subunit dehydrogenase-like oxidoreductase (DUF2520 family)
MDIVIIGTGNTATVLGNKIKVAGHKIVQVFGRNAQKSSELANALGADFTNHSATIYKNADLYLIAVSDRAIADVLKDFQLSGRPIAHTAGAVSRDILKPFSMKYGVFYPLQSLKKGVTGSPDIPILIDASDNSTLEILKSLAHSLSSIVMEADDEQRLKLHMAAVFCNNFVNYLYLLMERYCSKEGLDFRLLIPLIQETGKRLGHSTPAQAQTGPAIRNDIATLERHLSLLEDHPHLKELYQLLTHSIQQHH